MERGSATELPHIKVYTRFHSFAKIPKIVDLDDFEELLLFPVENSDDGQASHGSFWLIHEFDECLWILSASPGLDEKESVLAWCNAPSMTPKQPLVRKLITEWRQACKRHSQPDMLSAKQTAGVTHMPELKYVLKRLRFTPLHDAAIHNEHELITRLVNDDALIEIRDADGRTPLHVAVIHGNLEAIRTLLSLGASIKSGDSDGATPLDLARSTNQSDIEKLLEAEVPRSSTDNNKIEFPTPVTIITGQEPDPEELAQQLLGRAQYWADQKEYRMSWYLYDAAARMDGIPSFASMRAIRGSIRCLYFLGLVEDMESGIAEVSQESRYPIGARAKLLSGTVRRFLRNNDTKEAEKWLAILFSLKGISPEIGSHASIQLAECKDRNGDTMQAIQELDDLLSIADLPETAKTRACLLRGTLRYNEGFTQSAIADLTLAIELANSFPRFQAKALVSRSRCYEELGQPQQVIKDLTQAVKLNDHLMSDAAAALHNYGVRCNLRGQPEKAFEYFTAVTDFEGKSPFVQTNAIVNRGSFLGENCKYDDAIVEFKRALSTAEIPDEVLASATYNLGNARRLQGNFRAAIRHFSFVYEMNHAPEETLAASFCREGICWGQLNKPAKGIRLLSQALASKEADSETVADALLWLGIYSHDLDDLESAQQSFIKLIDLPTATVEMKARAKWGLGGVTCDRGDTRSGCELYYQARKEFMSIGRQDLIDIWTKR